MTRIPERENFPNEDAESDDTFPIKDRRFKASNQLISFIVPINSEDLRGQSSDDEKLLADELKKFITTRIERMFATLGFRAQAEELETLPITKDGRFKKTVESGLIERFPVNPDKADGFTNTLQAELRSYIQKGGSLGGDWGQLAISNNDLVLELAPYHPSEMGEWELPTYFESGVGKKTSK